MSNKKNSIESQLSKLEEIVNILEQGDLSIDQALQHFENGVKHASSCRQSLLQAEQTVLCLVEQHGLLDTVPLNLNNSEPRE